MAIPVQGEEQLGTEWSLGELWIPETQLHPWEGPRDASTGSEGPWVRPFCQGSGAEPVYALNPQTHWPMNPRQTCLSLPSTRPPHSPPSLWTW